MQKRDLPIAIADIESWASYAYDVAYGHPRTKPDGLPFTDPRRDLDTYADYHGLANGYADPDTY